MPRLCILVFFLQVAVYQLSVSAQSRDLKFEHITTRDGLSQSTVTCMLQDSKGFMWFGTQTGLNKYDGYNFTVYHDDPAGLLGSFIFRIIEDRDGNIWVGTDGGLNMFDRVINKFIRYKTDENDPGSIGGTEVRAVFEDSEGNLWVGSTGGGLSLFIEDSGEFIHYQHDANNQSSLSSNDVCAIFEDRWNNLWIGSLHGDLDRFDREKEVFYPCCYKDKKLSDDEIWNISGDREGNLWISTYRSGLYKMSFSDKGEPELFHYIHDIKDVNSISGNYIFTVFEDSNGRLWIGTENEGLNLFDRENNRFIHYRADPFDEYSLNNNSIWSVYEDKTGNIWVGTHAGGIHLLPKYGGYFKHYKHYTGNEYSLSHNSVTSFCEDSRGNFWIGTDGGGLNLFNRSSQTFTHYHSENSNLGSEAVLSVFEDSKGNLWVGTWEGGLNLFDRGSGTFRRYTKENSNLISNSIFSIYEDKEGILWIGSFFGGVSYFDRDRNDFINYTPENSDLSDNQIRVVTEDSYGNLWICGALGLNLFNRETETFSLYRHEENNNRSLTMGYVLSIVETSDSTLWVGTTGGLNKYDRGSQDFTQYHVKDGLPDDAVKGIREDDQGNLWISTNRGLSRFSPETGVFSNYDISDGLQDNEFYQCSHYKSANGELFFGGVNGFNVFHPDKLVTNPYIPPVVITDFRIFNRPVPIGRNSPLQAHISEAEQVRLSYKQSVFSLEFTALNFISPNKNQYKYKLEGFDQQWNHIGTRHTASYTNLDPGEYTFRVKGSNNDGVWNDQGASIEIIITPPYWKTWWFRILMFIIFACTLLLIYYIRTRQIISRNIVLNELVRSRTREIDEKNKILIDQTDELKAQRDELSRTNAVKDKLFSIISHDLRSPFTTLKGFIELIRSRYDGYNDKERKDMLAIIGESADRVYDLLDNLLNWSRSQSGKIQLKMELTNLNSLINDKIDLVKYQASNKNINIEYEDTAGEINLMIDARLISVVIQNLLTNAIKYTGKDGRITVSCTRTNEVLIISVKDNGVGMAEEDIRKLFRHDVQFSLRGTDNETGTGLGLMICKDFVERHGGKIWVESELNRGSVFFFSLPLALDDLENRETPNA